MKKALASLLVLVFCALTFAPCVFSAGSCVITTKVSGKFKKYSVAWTADANGDVNDSSTCNLVISGKLVGVEFLASTTNSPSALYDVTLYDSTSIPNDVLNGRGANITAGSSGNQSSWYRSVLDADGGYMKFVDKELYHVVDNAGNATTGTTVYKVEE